VDAIVAIVIVVFLAIAVVVEPFLWASESRVEEPRQIRIK